jgi:hypothetical protein
MAPRLVTKTNPGGRRNTPISKLEAALKCRFFGRIPMMMIGVSAGRRGQGGVIAITGSRFSVFSWGAGTGLIPSPLEFE